MDENETSDKIEIVEEPSPGDNGASGRMTIARAMQFLQEANDAAIYLQHIVRDDSIADFGDGPRAGGVADEAGTVQAAMPGAVQISFIYPGAYAWAYRTEPELRQIRAVSRVFCEVNPYAAGVIRNRVAYGVGTGHVYRVTARKAGAIDDATLDDCRTILDNFRKRNKWSTRQKETVRRLDRDGERFLRLFIDEKKGELNVRFVEPLEIQNPPNKSSLDGCYFGIQFAEVKVDADADSQSQGVNKVWDVETPAEYYVVNIGTLGECISLRETVPASEMQHLKANVDITWPRGLPTLWTLQPHLENAVKTLKATGKIVEFRARIGMIRRHINAMRESVQKFVEQSRNADNDPRHVKTADQYPYAAIIDASDATEYQFPAGTVPVDGNIAAVQADLRAAASALGMPEFLLSADASNGSYSSTMVAEGPAVKNFEELQAELIDADVEILERQLVVAAKAGLISNAAGDPPDDDSTGTSTYILDLVKIEVEPPLIKHEESLSEANADQIIFKLGVMSKATLAARHKLVFADEEIQIQKEQDQGAAYRAKMQALGFQFDPLSGQMIPPPPQPPALPPAPATTGNGYQGSEQESLQEDADLAALARTFGCPVERYGDGIRLLPRA